MNDEMLHEIGRAIDSLETNWRTRKRPSKQRTKMENQIREDLVKRIGEEETEKYWPGIVKAARARLEETKDI